MHTSILVPTYQCPPITNIKVVHHGAPAGNPPNLTPPPGTTLPPTSTAFSFGTDVTTMLHQKVHIDINHHAHHASTFPIKALIRDILLELQKAAPTTMILPSDDTSTAGALTVESDIRMTSDEGLNKPP